MRVEASYPVWFRGKPKRAARDKDVFITDRRMFDIPEVSVAEMSVVFETSTAFLKQGGHIRDRIVNNQHQVRMMDGTLYRLASPEITDESARSLFLNAFPIDDFSPVFYRAEISIASDAEDWWQLDRSPLSRPLYEQLNWRLQCEQLTTKRLEDLWPPNNSIRGVMANPAIMGRGYRWPRNHMAFVDLRREFDAVDETQVAYCETAATKHMGRFVIVDGELWQKTRGPVYAVRHNHKITIEHAPEWHDRNLTTKYFDLDEREAAFAYADDFAKAKREAGSLLDKPVQDYTVPFEVDDALPGFESAHDDLLRVGCGVAAENRRFLVRNPNKAARFAPERLSAVWRAFDEVRKTDYVFGEYGDPIDDIQANIEIWISSGRRQATYTFGEDTVSNMMFRRIQSLELDRPVLLQPTFGSPLGHSW
jgi:hypothetical protein